MMTPNDIDDCDGDCDDDDSYSDSEDSDSDDQKPSVRPRLLRTTGVPAAVLQSGVPPGFFPRPLLHGGHA
eukprot:9504118-Pyramimonas_sp.AAC.2